MTLPSDPQEPQFARTTVTGTCWCGGALNTPGHRWWVAREVPLCDPDGVVRRGAMHSEGRDYECTGSAHFQGMHIRCTSPAHAGQAVYDEQGVTVYDDGGQQKLRIGNGHASVSGQLADVVDIARVSQNGHGMPSIDYQPDRPGGQLVGEVVTPEGHTNSLTCPCGPVLGPDRVLLHTLESAGGEAMNLIELSEDAKVLTFRLGAPGRWVFVQVGPDTFDWRPLTEFGVPAGGSMISGAQLVAAERARQVMFEGYTADHDRQHSWETLVFAGMAYRMGEKQLFPAGWEWKPKNAIRDLIRAGALFEAALDVAQDRGLPRGVTRAAAERDATIRVLDELLGEARAILDGSL